MLCPASVIDLCLMVIALWGHPKVRVSVAAGPGLVAKIEVNCIDTHPKPLSIVVSTHENWSRLAGQIVASRVTETPGIPSYSYGIGFIFPLHAS